MRVYGCRMSSGLPDSDEQIGQKIDGTVESFGNGAEECRLEHRKEVKDKINKLPTFPLFSGKAVQKNVEQEIGKKSQETSQERSDRINKLPTFLLFSGTEPVLKDKCGIVTFLFQVKVARKDMNQAV